MRASVGLVALLSIAVAGTAGAWSGGNRYFPGQPPERVAIASDRALGAYIVSTISGQLLIARHLGPEGDPSPLFPTGGLLLGGATNGAQLGAVEDGIGGAYVWWTEAGGLYLTRVTASGVATGWTARGKLLGRTTYGFERPWIDIDGVGGVFIGFLKWGPTLPAPEGQTRCYPIVFHLTSAGTGTPGFPSSGKSFINQEVDEQVVAAAFARARDGGLWVLSGAGPVDLSAWSLGPGEWRLRRLKADGNTSPNFDGHGKRVADFAADLTGGMPAFRSPVALIATPDGGLLALRSEPTGPWGDGRAFGPITLHKYRADGREDSSLSVPRWVGDWFDGRSYGLCENGPRDGEYSPQLVLDSDGFPVMATHTASSDASLGMALERLTWNGKPTGRLGVIRSNSFRLRAGPRRSVLVASFQPKGPGPWTDEAYVSGGFWGVMVGYSERYWAANSCAVYDADAAVLPDGGGMLVWSRFDRDGDSSGVWVARIPSAGTILDVEPAAAAPALRLRKVDGRLVAMSSAGAEGRLQLLDLAGRRVGSAHLREWADECVILLAHPLAPGLYFARLERRDGQREFARWVVTQ